MYYWRGPLASRSNAARALADEGLEDLDGAGEEEGAGAVGHEGPGGEAGEHGERGACGGEDAVGEANGVHQLVGDHHDGPRVFSLQRQEFALDGGAGEAVEGGEGLVEEDQFGAGDEGRRAKATVRDPRLAGSSCPRYCFAARVHAWLPLLSSPPCGRVSFG
jgi:hypothetical protein